MWEEMEARGVLLHKSNYGNTYMQTVMNNSPGIPSYSYLKHNSEQTWPCTVPCRWSHPPLPCVYDCMYMLTYYDQYFNTHKVAVVCAVAEWSKSSECKSDYGFFLWMYLQDHEHIIRTMNTACNQALYIRFSSVFFLQVVHEIAVSRPKHIYCRLLRQC